MSGPHPRAGKYNAGQMQNEAACESLEKVLRNTSDDCMVRHEVNEPSKKLLRGALGRSGVSRARGGDGGPGRHGEVPTLASLVLSRVF